MSHTYIYIYIYILYPNMKHVGTKGSVIKYGREGLKWTFTPTKLFIGKGEREGGGGGNKFWGSF